MKKDQKKIKYIFSRKNVFTWLFSIIKYLLNRPGILHAPGSHIITAYPGMGKTLLMSKIINEVDRSKYFFISNLDEFNDVKTFDINEFFNNNEQQKSVPLIDEYGRHIYAIIFDEINLQFNRRLNRKSSYNEIFVGLIEFLVSHRHQGIPRVYFIGQKLELQDTQLQSLFRYQHDILKCKRFPKYWFYYENGHINMIPRKLVIMHRLKSKETLDQFDDYKKKRYKIRREDLENYNTKALADTYVSLEKLTLK